MGETLMVLTFVEPGHEWHVDIIAALNIRDASPH